MENIVLHCLVATKALTEGNAEGPVWVRKQPEVGAEVSGWKWKGLYHSHAF